MVTRAGVGGAGVTPRGGGAGDVVLVAGALASQEAKQDPIDLAFLAAAKQRHIFDNLPKVTPVSFAPFDAKNRRTEAVVEQNGQRALRLADRCYVLEAGSVALQGRSEEVLATPRVREAYLGM